MQRFKNLIFDLGDVIIDIDYNRTVAEFQKLATVNFSEIVSYANQISVFDFYEKGKISNDEFYSELKKYLLPGTTDEQIKNAWNAIFTNFPQHKVDLLLQLKTKYNTFALSNINQIHVDAINEVAKIQFNLPQYGSLFHHAYYSNEVGYRKPMREIYELVLDQQKLKPNETLFIDDKKENVEAAKALGIHACQLTNRNKLTELLTELEII